MPDVTGFNKVKIQPNTVNLPITLTLEICSSATANDGSIPYGDTLASAVVKAYSPAGVDVTSKFVTQAATISGNVIICEVSFYSDTVGEVVTPMADGLYKLTFIYTCASGYVDEIDVKRFRVKNT